MRLKEFIPMVLSLVALPAFADTLTIQGVGGTMDAHGRSPILTVNTEEGSGVVTISADAYVKHSKYIKYPIRYQFFVNRELISTQFSSPELPGTARVVVDEKIATIPFNYTVIADLVYPNRTFSSVLQAAVEKKAIKSNYDCVLTIKEGEADSNTYSATATVAASSESEFNLSFEGVDEEDEDAKVKFEGSFGFGDGALLGSAQYTEDSEEQKIELTGKADVEDGILQSFTAATDGDSVTLECE